jgi:transcriptional regulator with XRE-family HTH domain
MKVQLPKKANDIDREIGLRLRKWRLAQGMEASELADRLGVTYQQLRKYEKGLTRVTASRLYEIALTLNVPIHWFFREPGPDSEPTAKIGGDAPAAQYEPSKHRIARDR